MFGRRGKKLSIFVFIIFRVLFPRIKQNTVDLFIAICYNNRTIAMITGHIEIIPFIIGFMNPGVGWRSRGLFTIISFEFLNVGFLAKVIHILLPVLKMKRYNRVCSFTG